MSFPDALRTEHKALKKAVPLFRKTAHEEEGPLAQTFREAMRLWDIQKADGLSFQERRAGLEQSLRLSWPKGREWKYLCADCEDYGLRMATCVGDADCGRVKLHQAHTYGKPCWCQAGGRFKDKPRAMPEDFRQAGKSKPMSKMGR